MHLRRMYFPKTQIRLHFGVFFVLHLVEHGNRNWTLRQITVGALRKTEL